MSQRQEPSALGRVVELVRDLRARCAWDKAQTRETLRPYFVEEALELDHALSMGETEQIRIELGDVLLHVAFQVVLAEERGEFGADDLARSVEEKMWRRHPHLFGAGEHQDTWERQKLTEQLDRKSILDGLPPTMPPLLMAYRLQERAAGVGFDWPNADGPRAKVREEVAELEAELTESPKPDRVSAELGDLLFAVVNLARKLDCDPRQALETANRSFERRFREVERRASSRNIDMVNATLEQLDALWDEIKEEEKASRAKADTSASETQ